MSNDHTKWTELLDMAVKQLGMLMKAYRAFHNYSLGNQVLAMIQCQMREIEPGPINLSRLATAWPTSEERREGINAVYATGGERKTTAASRSNSSPRLSTSRVGLS